jgi:chromosome segregation ATPase
LTPVRHRKFKKNKSELFLNKKSEIKDIQKLQNELNMLTKQFSKLDKSLKRKNEELKKIKLLNDDLLKENNAQKKIIDTINNEKVMLNSKIISLKDYCNKVESKLVGGSKNQHLIEINNKLRLENESLINQIKFYESDKNDLMKNNELLQDELNLLKTEFQTLSERNNNKINIGKNSDNKNKTAKLISELTQEKKINKKQEEEIKQLKYELNKKDLILHQKEEEIQSINYGKSQMTSIIAQKENEIHNLIIERDSFQKHYQECNNQLKNLKDKLKENEEREENNKASFKLKDQYEAVIKKYINEISSLKKENNKLNDKLKDNENIIKEYDLVLNDKNKIGKSQNFEELISKLELEMNEQIKNKKNWINNDKEIFSKLNEEKEKSLKLINDIETLII